MIFLDKANGTMYDADRGVANALRNDVDEYVQEIMLLRRNEPELRLSRQEFGDGKRFR